jgi:phage-related protein
MGRFRTIRTYKGYTVEFLDTQPNKVRDKIIWTFQLIEEIEVVPITYLKHIEDGIYEVRIKLGSNIFRIMSFFDNENLILTINGFQKKTQKTPKSEIVKAKKIRKEYEQEKSKYKKP